MKEDWLIISVYGIGIVAVTAVVLRKMFSKPRHKCRCGGAMKEIDRIQLPSGSAQTFKCPLCGAQTSQVYTH